MTGDDSVGAGWTKTVAGDDVVQNRDSDTVGELAADDAAGMGVVGGADCGELPISLGSAEVALARGISEAAWRGLLCWRFFSCRIRAA
jgi:hypothetical protein